MPEQPVIRRYFATNNPRLQSILDDLGPVLDSIDLPSREILGELRDNCLDLYYHGNTLARIELPWRREGYRVKIANKFLVEDPSTQVQGDIELSPELDGLNSYNHKAVNRGYYQRFSVQDDLESFFANTHIEALKHSITKVNYKQELKIEQETIHNNPPTSDFMVIDRQISQHGTSGRIDLMALARRTDADKFQFAVIELKLATNKDLPKVADQLRGYVSRVKESVESYARCYELNYQQKRQLGLLPAFLPDTIAIETNPNSVVGAVAVGGNTHDVNRATQQLKDSHPDLKVVPLDRLSEVEGML